MKSIDLSAKFDDGVKTLTITQPVGSEDSYHLFIDRHYQGAIVRYKGEWVGHLNELSRLTRRNIQTIGVIIEKRFKED